MSEREMQITINGEPRPLAGDEETLASLLSRLEIDPAQVAVEKNMEIIPRSRYGSEPVKPGDAVELVEFVGGG